MWLKIGNTKTITNPRRKITTIGCERHSQVKFAMF